MVKVLHIGNKLQRKGYSPTLVDWLPKKLKKEGIDIRGISDIGNKTGRLFHIIWDVIGSKRCTYLLIDTYSTSNFWFAVLTGLVARIKNQKYIFVFHGGNLPLRLDKSSDFVMNLFRDAHTIVIPSAYLVQETKKYNWRNTVYIPNSIELKDYSFKLRKKVKPRLLWVRSFAEVYNPTLALNCLKILLQTYPNAELCMVGPEKDGSLEKMKELAKESSLPVKFTGKFSKDEWRSLSRDYDIFLNTTNVDNTPVSVIEAMALGLPVVSTNVGGIPYLLDNGKTGIMVRPDDPGEMVNGIVQLLENSDLAEIISKNARLKVENFDWEKVKSLWLDLLA
ncbi:glycosyltransferase family 4 protein [Christiangramia aquimixticola]|uniref:glycosyltransferase family 4 protein n=1 Tax=Christiangramia aquimixticola TaxID=1697558 RepID=UPI003AA7BC23